MRIPKVLTVCGQAIQVRYRKGLVVDGQEAWGCYDSDKHVIWLRQGMEKTRRMEILLHEVVHAVESIHTLNLPEKAVKILGVEMLAFIRNNHINLLERRKPVK